MNHESTPDFSVSGWRQIDELCDQFEKAWRSGERPTIESILPAAEPRLRNRILRELILLDVEYRRIAGESPTAAEYAKRFGDAGDVVRQAFDNRLTKTVLEIDGFDQIPMSPGRESHEPGRMFVRKVASHQTSDDDPNIGRIIGVYQLVERLGHGGMGNVYRAEHTIIDSERAIKLLRPALAQNANAVKRFLREAEATITELSHPHIVKTFDLLRDDEEFYLLMELVDGCDLARLVEKSGPMPLYDAARAIEQAASGLAFAHDRGFIHRDIKPHNLILRIDGTVKVLDFGLVRALQELEVEGEGDAAGKFSTIANRLKSSRLSESKSVLGTLAYMSPEQLRDSRQADARSDLYSLGCTLYFLLTGVHAFDGTTHAELLQSLLLRNFRPPGAIRRDLPASLEAIVMKAMSPDPQSRFASAKQFARALRAWRLQERIDIGLSTSEDLTFETVEELGHILLKLQIVSHADWDRASRISTGRGLETGATTFLSTWNDSPYQSAHLKSEDSDRYSVSRVLDALGFIHRDHGPGRGLSAWQRNTVMQGNADLLRLPEHVLCDKVGYGWKGEVFVARHVNSNELASLRTFAASALTGLPGDETERLTHFVEHAARVADLVHPVLAEVRSFDTCHNRAHPRLAYFATEWIKGTSVVQYAAAHPWRSDRDRIAWLLQSLAELARSLEPAHRRGIYHLDLQDKCLQVVGDGKLKLVDLGIAQMVLPRRLGEPSRAIRPTRALKARWRSLNAQSQDQIIGTPQIMPPEQWIDRGTASPATDVYNLGCLLCRWLTGENPFGGATVFDLMQEVFSDSDWQPPKSVPTEVRPALSKMLKKRPEDRFQSMTELADAVDEITFRSSPNDGTSRNWFGRLWKRFRS